MICKHPNCTKVAASGYCKSHGPPEGATPGKERNKFYDSAVWKKCRARQLSRQPLCEHCLSWGMLRKADMVHHIIAIEHGGAKLNPDNLMSLCSGCHNEAHGGKGISKRE